MKGTDFIGYIICRILYYTDRLANIPKCNHHFLYYCYNYI